MDWNDQQIDGPVHEVSDLGNLLEKWRSFGWEAFVVMEGNRMNAVVDMLDRVTSIRKGGNNSPIVLLLRTQMGFGVDFMLDRCAWHGKAPNDIELQQALAQLGGEHLPEDF